LLLVVAVVVDHRTLRAAEADLPRSRGRLHPLAWRYRQHELPRR